MLLETLKAKSKSLCWKEAVCFSFNKANGTPCKSSACKMKINSLSPGVGLSYLMQKFVLNEVSLVYAESSGISTFLVVIAPYTNNSTDLAVGRQQERE